MRSLILTGITAFLAFATPFEVSAQKQGQRQEQDVQVHKGFWWGFGLGGGMYVPEGQTGESGGGGYLRFGGSIGQKFLLGFEVLTWTTTEGQVITSAMNATLTGLFYPSQAGGFYLKGGVGGATLGIQNPVPSGTLNILHSGGGATLGFGYDFRLGENIFLTPNIDFMAQTVDVFGTMRNATVTLITVGLAWH